MIVSARPFISEANCRANAIAIRERLYFAGVKNPAANENARVANLIGFGNVPEWKRRALRFDRHVWDWQEWRFRQIARVREHIAARCKDFGVSVDDIRSSLRTTEIVNARDQIIYEIKTEISPGISWPQLGRHFDRDHTSIMICYYRAGALAGDEDCIRKLEKKRRDARERQRRIAGERRATKMEASA